MKIKTKKQNEDGIVRLETTGEIKEVIINEDFLNPETASVVICFRGKNSSGIIEMTPEEIESLYQNISPKMNLLKGAKVMKFKK